MSIFLSKAYLMVQTNGVIPLPVDWHGGAKLHPYVVCDAFTSVLLHGNQLGVFVDGRPFAATDMQRLAREMNFSETVFLHPPSNGGDVALRISTLRTELHVAAYRARRATGVRPPTVEFSPPQSPPHPESGRTGRAALIEALDGSHQSRERLHNGVQ
jgi:hypothetical protein